MTKKIRQRVFLVLLSSFLGIGVFFPHGNQPLAQTEKEATEPPGPVKLTPTTEGIGRGPIYKPPLRGVPTGRVGGGTRGAPGGPDRLVVLAVLAPDHIGLTTQEQPSLYWYISQPTTAVIELTVAENQAVNPMLEKRINSPSQAGVQRIRLADYGVRLKPGIVYRWYITVVPDPNIRSKDILAGGLIERAEPSANLRTQLAQQGPAQAPIAYAEEGIWYDALSAISEMIDATPNDSALHAQRASLLEQVRLQEVAEFERRFGS